MSDPNPKRFVRLSNPVTPTVHTFSEVPTTPGKMTRLSNPVTPTVHTFPRVPVLHVTITRHPESDDAALPFIAARVITEVGRLEEAHGGRGIQYDPEGSVEEPTRLVLRLYPKLIDGGAADRLAKVAEELKGLMRQAREQAVERQDADLRSRVRRALAVQGVEEVVVA